MRSVALVSVLLIAGCSKAPAPPPAPGPAAGPGPAQGAPAAERPIQISLTIGGGSANRGQIIEARAGDLIVTSYDGASTSEPTVTPLSDAAWTKLVDALAAHDIHWVDAPEDTCGGGVALHGWHRPARRGSRWRSPS
jgi:hypothetical protein